MTHGLSCTLMTMSAVNIAEFKRHMGAYLARVRNGGEVTVSDRDRPIARIIPLETAPGLEIRPPPKGFEGINDVAPLPPKRARRGPPVDSLVALRKERERG